MSKYKFKRVQIMLGHIFHFQEEKSENIEKKLW